MQGQLERILASADIPPRRSIETLSQVRRSGNHRGPRRSAQGVRDRRPRVRQGAVLRSPRRPDRPRASEAAARAGGAILPRRGAPGRARHRPAEGTLLPLVQARRRPVDAQAIDHRGTSEPEHGRRAAVRGPQPRGRPGVFLQRPSPGSDSCPGRDPDAAGARLGSRGTGVAADPRQAVQTARAAMVITGSVRRSETSSA